MSSSSARVAGGRIGDVDDYPFMYQRQFDDPDGYQYSPFLMKPDAVLVEGATSPQPSIPWEQGGLCSSWPGCSRSRSATAICRATSECRRTFSRPVSASSKRQGYSPACRSGTTPGPTR